MRETSFDDWYSHDDPSCDVAVLPLGDGSDLRRKYDFLLWPSEGFVDDTVATESKIGIGNEVAIAGLFPFHAGTESNCPLVRIGHIAAIPEERVHTARYGKMEAVLIECLSIGGLSGSPVFAMANPVLEALAGNTIAVNSGREPAPIMYLLGVVHGHWDIDRDGTNVVSDFDGKSKVNTGIAIVTPATKILDIARHEPIRDEREAILEAAVAELNSPVED